MAQAAERRTQFMRRAVPLLLAAVAALVLAAPAQAHFADFTGQDDYGCSVVGGVWCWYTGNSQGSTGDGSGATNHSYGFQSAEYAGGGNRTVYTSICYSTCEVASGTNFRRLCWPNWRHSSDELDCHDQDGVSGRVRVMVGSGATIYGHPHW